MEKKKDELQSAVMHNENKEAINTMKHQKEVRTFSIGRTNKDWASAS
jgi:hypothetical protein